MLVHHEFLLWWSSKGLSPSALVLFLHLLRYRNHITGLCWPSVGRLVKESGLSERTIRAELPVLETAGVVTITRRPGRRKDGTGNCYLVRLPAEIIGVIKPPKVPTHEAIEREREKVQSLHGSHARGTSTLITVQSTQNKIERELEKSTVFSSSSKIGNHNARARAGIVQPVGDVLLDFINRIGGNR